jgi:carboxylate-amine ligase
MQCVLEINTGVCETIGEAEQDLRGKIAIVEQACDALGLKLWWGATHPFSSWEDQEITPDARYLQLVNLLQEMARRLVTFGLHVHVGVDSGDKAVMICDRIMRHLPTLLALSVSSPFWEGRRTGLYSHRSKVMEGLPTAGLPTLLIPGSSTRFAKFGGMCGRTTTSAPWKSACATCRATCRIRSQLPPSCSAW